MALLVHFLRHAPHDGGPDRLAGRDPAVRLSRAGLAEAEALAAMLAPRPLAAILASPQPRAAATAEIVARGRPVAVDPALDELDFGRWQGESFAALEHDPQWRAWNAERDAAATPAGETMQAVGMRVLDLVERLARRRPAGGEFALVSHLDTIRAALCRALAIPYRTALALEIAPASLTTLAIRDGTPRLALLNRRPGLDGFA